MPADGSELISPQFEKAVCRESTASAKEAPLFNNPPKGNPRSGSANIPLSTSTNDASVQQIASQQPAPPQQSIPQTDEASQSVPFSLTVPRIVTLDAERQL